MEHRTPWLRPAEAADYVRRTPEALRALRRRGRGPRCRIVGRRAIYHRDDLDKWLFGEVRR